MDALEAVKNRRSIRRFKQQKIKTENLVTLTEAARLAPAGANIQALKYIIVADEPTCEKTFKHLAWAGHVKPRRSPAPGQRPVAYIVVIFDMQIKPDASVDAAAAIENMLIAATSMGIGSCWLGSIDRKEISKDLSIPDTYKVDSVVALGYPDETPVAEDCKTNDTKYYLDENDRLHVPKRPLEKIVCMNKFAQPI